MIKELQLGRYQKARLWFNELPAASYASTSLKTLKMAAAGPIPRLRLAACEIHVPLGPRSLYGMLGCCFEPVDCLEIQAVISESSANGAFFLDSLRGKFEEVRIGLPPEYSSAVLAGLKMVSQPPRANLRFACAAHGIISSAPAIFTNLVGLLLNMSQIEIENVRDSDLAAMFPEHFG